MKRIVLLAIGMFLGADGLRGAEAVPCDVDPFEILFCKIQSDVEKEQKAADLFYDPCCSLFCDAFSWPVSGSVFSQPPVVQVSVDLPTRHHAYGLRLRIPRIKQESKVESEFDIKWGYAPPVGVPFKSEFDIKSEFGTPCHPRKRKRKGVDELSKVELTHIRAVNRLAAQRNRELAKARRAEREAYWMAVDARQDQLTDEVVGLLVQKDCLEALVIAASKQTP